MIIAEERLTSLEVRLADLEVREEIRSVLYLYCRAADRGDAELMKSCYHPDGKDDHAFFNGTGWDFVDYVLPILAQLEVSIHSLSNPIIELNGDQAFVETHWSVIHRLKRDTKMTDVWNQGRYLDLFERRDGHWKIHVRLAVLDAERWIDTADMRRLIRDDDPYRSLMGQRGKGDPVYLKERIGESLRKDTALPDLWGPLKRGLLVPRIVLHGLGLIAQRSRH
ncbi:hypothetical protein KDH_71810 [Dictyobacter sp. S3.2.2.5]|uniref:SnoaL-like domain-containing protein n=1 Tax=Dictyobacter halimunensis TaxID=3026934 RepID=A0ABQ6G6X3_9CHLR|nr:hypothetical protein KDH_71810 [Dictyobacter sp. S3.2.2.5]